MFLRTAIIILAGVSLVSVARAQNFEVTPIFALHDGNLSLGEVLDLSAQFNDRVLQTVFWSLGLVVAVLTVLMTLNWVVGNRTFERDRETFQLMIKSELDTLDRRQAAQLSAAITDTRKELQDQYQGLLDTQNQRLTNFSVEQANLVEKLGSDFESKIKKIEQRFLDALAVTKKDIDRHVLYSDMNYHELNAVRWEQKAVPANEIYSRIKYATALVQLEFSTGVINTQLQIILGILEKNDAGYAAEALQKLIAILPEAHAIERGKLVQALAKQI